jgi:hypothetical protein
MPYKMLSSRLPSLNRRDGSGQALAQRRLGSFGEICLKGAQRGAAPRAR